MVDPVMTLGVDEFYDSFTPLENHVTPDNGKRFETYGPDLAYITLLSRTEPNRVWTVVHDDEDAWYITPGVRYVNRLFFVVTKEAWADPHQDYEYWETIDI